MVTTIIKRDGRTAEFNEGKIAEAVERAFQACGAMQDRTAAEDIARKVVEKLESGAIEGVPTVEGVQDLVEETLIESGFVQTAKSYILYRAERSRARDVNSRLIQTLKDITFSKASDSDMKRENANIDADTAMGTMLKYGSESAKQFYEMCVIDPKFARAHREGDIHIHDMDFYTLTTTCCQIELKKLFKGGFSTGHGVLREPNDITSYAALACIAIQSNQNDQHGGQAICDFDYGLAEGVKKTYRRLYKKHLAEAVDLLADGVVDDARAFAQDTLAAVEEQTGLWASLKRDEGFEVAVREALVAAGVDEALADKALAYTARNAHADTDRATFQAMEALVHNLNTMHSRAGAQTPFSSVNYGMDTSPEGRMVVKNMLLATEGGLGSGETPIFPVQIFRVKEGVNYNPEDPNYDLFKLAMHCSAKRLFPNFSFLDAPFNIQYYQGTPETEIAYMGCRTRVMGNVYDPDREVTPGRGNLSFTSINLPRLAIRSKGDLDLFFDLLDAKLALTVGQLDERFEIQARKKVYNAPFLMGQGVWIDSEKLAPGDEQREVLKHGTLSVGFIGLAEALVALTGQHHGQSQASQNLGLEIIGHMRGYLDRLSAERKMNYGLIATPAEGLSGRFVRMDRARYGSIAGVTDRDYYTNGFHVPVYYDISAFDKIEIEAPYHALTNAGHISYVELDGDPSENLEAFEAVIRHMKDSGIGYGSVNHPVDRDPVCGYNGIIGDVCPKCGRTEEEHGMAFERIRRITGYLVGTLDRFNDAKRAEEADRVKHFIASADQPSQ
ncbi:MAG: anaerobic ribonucleoside triphosphate reductase [Gordonibacter pamelaeae]|uniref:Ribonucleoside-triphosphate reductase class III catalytic subunit n=2 Tax=Gordonibacter pamelaeae TaxID=471189 RepID=D6E8Y8_9ACTN|nr:anaerobic ribonucleoside triphosphate reductase [Gordonibacter pamelaeae]HJH73016.1 anaerobic ribonucleoside triphosphate reductase [Eggerthellaceae bacterium]MBS4895938.1 anaerobic ribonucleoside triphosphate reductase [Gordonibacter pamelaeae]MCB6311102.1 anaerobic ribonucleoside triphosphate reductase [Gordonibacter pamelaeae]RDB64153.1 anaerobic ribonucleoside-triphosphate reductase [Gordonibacter pamelaeae]CBL04185.1 ribonucleoside-triphosphate reductase class III catalytic subunit [Go